MCKNMCICLCTMLVLSGCREDLSEELVERSVEQNATGREARRRTLEIRFCNKAAGNLSWRCVGLGCEPVSENFCHWLMNEFRYDAGQDNKPVVHVYFPQHFPCVLRRAVVSLVFSAAGPFYTHNECPSGAWLTSLISIINPTDYIPNSCDTISDYVEDIKREITAMQELVDVIVTSDIRGHDIGECILSGNIIVAELMDSLVRYACKCDRLILTWRFRGCSYAESFCIDISKPSPLLE